MPERCCWGDGSGDPAGRSRFADYFADSPTPELIEHEVATLVGHRVFGIALGYEDLVDHDELRHGPTMAVLAGKLSARRKDCAPLAGNSTLNRLERGGAELTRYHRIAWDGAKIEALLSICFWRCTSTRQSRSSSISTPPTIHCTHQEGRFFHGYGACPRGGEAGPPGDWYCYLPLYIFSGPHLLAAN